MIYKENKYIYPPRVEKAFPKSGLSNFDNNSYLAQPKFNGTCAEIYTGPKNWKYMTRHKTNLTDFKVEKNEILKILKNDDSINMFVCEYMNKSKKDENNNVFHNKLVIIDLIVYNNEHLIGKTYQERIDIMNNMFEPIDENYYSYKLTDNIYYTKTFYENFNIIWDNLVKIDMLEGLVLKRINSKLELGVTERNNHLSLLKVRKETKNYNY